MADFRKMTVEALRELARKLLGPGHSRFKTKGDLVTALESTGDKPAKPAAAKTPARTKASPPAKVSAAPKTSASPRSTRGGSAPASKAAKKGKATAKAAKEGARSAARTGKQAVKAAVSEVAEKVRAAMARESAGSPPRKRGGKLAAAVAGAAAGIAGVAARTGRRAGTRSSRPGEGPVDPAGFFVARVRGEDAVREAPHPMTETAEALQVERGLASGADDEGHPDDGGGDELSQPVNGYREGLGDLPWGYGDDAFVALPRDPRTLFLYWDLAQPTVHAGFDDMDQPRAQLWVYARTDGGWERVRTLEFALEARGYYVHELDPGRVYRAEIHAVDRRGQDRVVGRASNEMMLPPLGLSPVIDDRFIRIPWDLPLGRLLGPGHAGGPFSDEARALLARLSDWSRFSARGGSGGGGSAGGVGGRTSTAPSSPGKGFGSGEGS